ncbi:GNAT family N-acetyltransferase [Lelliottia aquatilis]|jgi:RimJ/RimL family protein N-acetyltransferase|uniref:GNAT family N-acetyltransferase n=1 Tax=Lelliottia aquatilis TaxID=2080838 RepID=UPI00192B7DCB|nr:GNAT family N-acetyltransferase [Lelliottia aquatilis]MBL5882986.1 GNAT family N-acetyltransferase [Lelliottia aquatilis]
MSSYTLRFVTFDEIYLAKSWGWLNDVEIKKLTNTPDFTQTQQRAFFDSLPRDDYKVWGMECNDFPIGVVGLKKITSSSAEYFGYIGEKNYWGKGLFTSILDFIRLEAKRLDINLIYLNVCSDNQRAIRAYQREGFIVSTQRDDLIEMTMRVA